jgi:hypothetical protein
MMVRALWFPATVLLIVGLWAYTRFAPRDELAMPTPASDEEVRRLYSVPGGKYTAADIAANGPAGVGEIPRLSVQPRPRTGSGRPALPRDAHKGRSAMYVDRGRKCVSVLLPTLYR